MSSVYTGACQPKVRTRLLPHALALAGNGGLQEPSILTLLVQDVGGCGDRGCVAVGLSRGWVCKTDLWALGSSLSSEDAGLDVLVVPELCLVSPMLSPSNGVCFTVSPPRVADVCVCT